jgi:hypothetical protein
MLWPQRGISEAMTVGGVPRQLRRLSCARGCVCTLNEHGKYVLVKGDVPRDDETVGGWVPESPGLAEEVVAQKNGRDTFVFQFATKG